MMMEMNLSKQDYFKLLKFIDRAQHAKPEEFRQSVLTYLADIFSFDLTTFWLADSNGDMFDPVTLSVDRRIIDMFQNQYYKYDPFYPKNLPSHLSNKDLITIQDITTFKEYQNNIYYKEVLEPYKLPYKTMYVYRNHNGKILGASTFLRSENSNGFNLKDYSLIKTSLKYVSNLLANKLLLDNLDFQKNMFESLSNYSNTGLFIINGNYKVIYSNLASVDYCRNLLSSTSIGNPVDNFVKEFLYNNNMWRYGLTTTLYSNENKAFSVKIVPQMEQQRKHHYFVIIQPINTEEPEETRAQDLFGILTMREREILIQVLKGCTNKEIANELFISLATVKAHIQSIFNKCNVSNRTALCYLFKNIQI